MRKNDVYKTLIEELYPFWNRLYDPNGGFYGYVDSSGHMDTKANRGALLQLRILWFYSKLYSVYPNDEVKKYAYHAYDFITKYFISEQGTIWEVDQNFKTIDDTHHIYYQAFTVYGLCEYYKSFKDEKALKQALKIYQIMESMKDEYGYIEQHGDKNRLADLGFNADKTMNSIIHIMEAYTLLYEVTRSKKVYKSLIYVLELIANKVFNPSKNRLEVFFDHQMNSLVDYHSYGHDIEASWLLELTLPFIKDNALKRQIKNVAKSLVKQVYTEAFKTDYITTEKVLNVKSDNKIWWCQAEAVLGFHKAYEHTYLDQYKTARDNIYAMIHQNFKANPKQDWCWELNEQNIPNLERPLVSNWKCPYHNGRMYIELIKEM